MGVTLGVFQVIGDWARGLCLSPHQFFWRGMVALGFGLVGGAIGLLVGGYVLGVLGITATVATFSVAGILAWGASLTFAITTSGAKTYALEWITKEMDW